MGQSVQNVEEILNDSTEKKRNVTVVLEELLKTHLEAQYRKREELHAKKVEKWNK